MHTIKLNIPDIIYPEIMSLLKKYPNVDIVEDKLSPDFIVSYENKLKVPNKETLKAIKDTRANKNMTKVSILN
jgi:hypothetical protein